jgi:hypothetical protein
VLDLECEVAVVRSALPGIVESPEGSLRAACATIVAHKIVARACYTTHSEPPQELRDHPRGNGGDCTNISESGDTYLQAQRR